jgi:hypothetical protein
VTFLLGGADALGGATFSFPKPAFAQASRSRSASWRHDRAELGNGAGKTTMLRAVEAIIDRKVPAGVVIRPRLMRISAKTRTQSCRRNADVTVMAIPANASPRITNISVTVGIDTEALAPRRGRRSYTNFSMLRYTKRPYSLS